MNAPRGGVLNPSFAINCTYNHILMETRMLPLKPIQQLFLGFSLIVAPFNLDTSLALQISLPKDAEGWTFFSPSVDTDVIFISESGNDGSCRSYRTSDFEMGSDPFHPVGTVLPCATYSKAYSLTGDNEPDWILFKRGETFVDTIEQSIRNGKNANEPFLVSAYGSSGENPLLKTGANGALVKDNPLHWVAVMGLDFYAHTRVPDSPDYIGAGGNAGIDFVLDAGEGIEGILLEGCKFGFYSNNRMQKHQGTYLKDITFRRNIFYKNYSTTSHAQGLFTDQTDGFIFEENIWWHNGWLIQNRTGDQGDKTDGQATYFNHNMYIAGATNMTILNNIFIEPANTGIKMTSEGEAPATHDVSIDNCLFIGGELGVNIGNNYPSLYRFKNVDMTNNIFTDIGRSKPTNRDISWGMWINGWDQGVISDNLLIHQRDDTITNTIGMYLRDNMRDTSISRNVLYNLSSGSGIVLEDIESNLGIPVSGVVITNNEMQLPSNYSYMITTNFNTVNYIAFSNNKYYSNGTDRFNLNNSDMNFTSWSAASGDNSTFDYFSLPVPSRSIETYQESIGNPPTIEAFISACVAQDRFSWNTNYSATKINNWIKAGFSLATSPTIKSISIQ